MSPGSKTLFESAASALLDGGATIISSDSSQRTTRSDSDGETTLRWEELRRLVIWRWVMLPLGVAATLLGWGLNVLAQGPQIIVFLTLLALGNLWWQRVIKRNLQQPTTPPYYLAFGQLLADLLVLIYILHLAGGIANPLVALVSLHMVLAGTFLSRRQAIWLALISGTLISLIVLAEMEGWLSHHPLGAGFDSVGLAVDGAVVSVYLASIWTANIGIVMFVSGVRRRLRAVERAKRQQEHAAQTLEQLARVGGIAGGVVHTIRNPLHGVLNCLELLNAPDTAADERAEISELMREGLERIQLITDRLVELTRSREPERRPVSPRDMLEDLVNQLQPRASEQRVELCVEAGEQLVSVDPARINEALIQIASNAIEASGPGGEVTLRALVGIDGEFSIEVTDSGRGIDDAIRPHIFEPFFSTKAIGDGPGIGLALAERIVHEHGGWIEIDSASHRGTRVRMILPQQPESGLA